MKKIMKDNEYSYSRT